MSTNDPLSLSGVSFAYGVDRILEEVDLRVGPGEFVALVGPNGSGKSTLLRIAVGLLSPAQGQSLLFGVPPGRFRDRGLLGFVPQRPALGEGITGTVEDIVASGRLTRVGLRRRRSNGGSVERALQEVGLIEQRKARLSELSGGQQQRAFIARALAGEPELLVLDEPVAGVDAESQRLFRSSLIDLVKQRGGSVLLVSHELGAVADDLDRVIVLKQTIRFDGTPEELSSQGVSLGVHAADLPLWLERVH
jgi:zinc transport system ATP-binding protein